MEKNQGELPHVGNMISEFMKARFISQSEGARRIGVTPSQMSKYLKSPTLQTHTLWKFCVALEHDFLSDLAKKNPAYQTPPEDPRIREMQMQIDIYKDLLKR